MELLLPRLVESPARDLPEITNVFQTMTIASTKLSLKLLR